MLRLRHLFHSINDIENTRPILGLCQGEKYEIPEIPVQ